MIVGTNGGSDLMERYRIVVAHTAEQNHRENPRPPKLREDAFSRRLGFLSGFGKVASSLSSFAPDGPIDTTFSDAQLHAQCDSGQYVIEKVITAVALADALVVSAPKNCRYASTRLRRVSPKECKRAGHPRVSPSLR